MVQGFPHYGLNEVTVRDFPWTFLHPLLKQIRLQHGLQNIRLNVKIVEVIEETDI